MSVNTDLVVIVVSYGMLWVKTTRAESNDTISIVHG